MGFNFLPKTTDVTLAGSDYKICRWLARFTISTQMRKYFDFSIRRENDFDRACKKLHLVSELTIGKLIFDKELYIYCDDAVIVGILQQNSELAHEIILYFEKNQLRKIESRNGKLSFEFNSQLYDINKFDYKTEKFAELLKKINDACSNVDEFKVMASNEKSRKARNVIRLNYSLVLLGIAMVTYDSYTNYLFLGGYNIAKLAIKSTLIGTAALMFASIFYIGKSSRRHVAILWLMLCGFFSFFTAIVGLHAYNRIADNAPPTVLTAIVTEKYAYTKYKPGIPRKQYLTKFKVSNGTEFKKLLDYDTFVSLPVNTKVALNFHEGVFKNSAYVDFNKIKIINEAAE